MHCNPWIPDVQTRIRSESGKWIWSHGFGPLDASWEQNVGMAEFLACLELRWRLRKTGLCIPSNRYPSVRDGVEMQRLIKTVF